MSKKVFIILVLFISSFNLYSQVYQPLDTVCEVWVKKLIDEMDSRHKANIARIKDENSGDIKRGILAAYTDQFDELVKDFKKGELYFDLKNQNYLQQLFNNILTSNPDLQSKEMNIHFSRATNPNAFSIGDGTIIVHLELLNTLETEGQLTSVICHEIAHYTLEHRNKSIKRHYENLNSKENKKEEREIIHQKYNKQKRAENYLKDVVYSRKSKSRIHEMEADSLGFVYFKNTKYNPSNFTNALKNLEKSDIEKDSLVDADYKKFFVTKSQKFIDEWLVMEDFSGYHYSKENVFKWSIDSLKTHPDCAARVKNIETKLSKDNVKDFEIDNKYFINLKNAAQYELVANHYHAKEYGFSLYEALKLLKKKPNDIYLMKMVSENLKLLAKAKKEMKLNSYIPRINPKEQTNSQQRFCNFMNNLSINEIQRLTNDYIESTDNKNNEQIAK
jgi:predicted Zn-dependent protease